jgi:hypothetical protein
MRSLKSICRTALLFYALSTAHSLNAFPLVLSAREDRVVPLKTYTCQQKIYVHIQWTTLKAGPHHLEAIWHLPNGKVQETTVKDFKAPAQSAVMWLEAERPSFLQTELVRWAGEWTVDVQLDGKSLGVLPFEMTC